MINFFGCDSRETSKFSLLNLVVIMSKLKSVCFLFKYYQIYICQKLKKTKYVNYIKVHAKKYFNFILAKTASKLYQTRLNFFFFSAIYIFF